MQIGKLGSDETALILGGILLAGVIGWSVRSYYKNRPTPAELERRRRERLNQVGKVGDASVFEVNGTAAIYSYEVHGVEYTASQDLSSLDAHLPSEWGAIVGSASVKYDPRNPANSMVLSEQWSGVRHSSAKLEQ